MITINSDMTTGVISISDSYTYSIPTFNKIGDTYALSFVNLKNVKYFKKFHYEITGNTDYSYLYTDYRVSKDNKNFTPWSELNNDILDFIPFDPKYDMFVDIRWTRAGESNTGIISLLNYNLIGSLDRIITDGLTTFTLNSINNQVIVKPPFVYKIFKISDIEVLSKGDTASTAISYRYSQDYGRSVNKWTPFTKENIRSENISPIRFFQIEYLVNYTGSASITIFDINLVGDFQNVSKDSIKTNCFGVRSNCNSLLLSLVGDPNTHPDPNLPPTSMLLSDNKEELYQLTAQDKSFLYKPYQQKEGIALLNKLSNDCTATLGHDVEYILTDPDKNGIDYTLHEYQLYNYICQAKIKVSVDQNQFPDSQITLNQFDLSLFQSFEIHITKDDFKNAFGVEKRPNIKDVVYFCELDRAYEVEHAQPFRGFNNYALYYKVILKKYNKNANINDTPETKNAIDALGNNNTVDALMGRQNDLDKKAVANTEQLRTTAQDTLRIEILANIEAENIQNASILVSKNNYDLSSVTYGSMAITYRNFKNYFAKSDNIGFSCWFNINNITTNEIYNFFDYFDGTNGIRIDILNTSVLVNINNSVYSFNFGTLLTENIWYILVVNLDQRDTKLSAYIYKRNVSDEDDAENLTSTKLLSVYKLSQPFIPTIIDLSNSLDTNGNPLSATILGSDMKITNIRMFTNIIPEKQHTKILNKEILGDENRYNIFADNANKTVSIPFYTDSKVDYTKLRRGSGLDTGINLNTDTDE